MKHKLFKIALSETHKYAQMMHTAADRLAYNDVSRAIRESAQFKGIRSPDVQTLAEQVVAHLRESVMSEIDQVIRDAKEDGLSDAAIARELAEKYGMRLPDAQHFVAQWVADNLNENFSGAIAEVGYADALGDLNIPHNELVASAQPDGTISQRSVMKFTQGDDCLYFFESDGEIDALVLLAGNNLKAIKNYTNEKGLVFALLNHIVSMKGTEVRVDATEPLTAEGFKWLAALIKNKAGLRVRDPAGQEVDISALEAEWKKSKAGHGEESGPTGLVITEASASWKKKLIENEQRIMPFAYFNVSAKRVVNESRYAGLEGDEPERLATSRARMRQFMAKTGADSDKAWNYLTKNQWNLSVAIGKYQQDKGTTNEAQSMGSALRNELSKAEPGSKLDHKIKTHNRAVKNGLDIGKMAAAPDGYYFDKKGYIRLGESVNEAAEKSIKVGDRVKIVAGPSMYHGKTGIISTAQAHHATPGHVLINLDHRAGSVLLPMSAVTATRNELAREAAGQEGSAVYPNTNESEQLDELNSATLKSYADKRMASFDRTKGIARGSKQHRQWEMAQKAYDRSAAKSQVPSQARESVEGDIDQLIDFHKTGLANAQYKGPMAAMHRKKLRALMTKKQRSHRDQEAADWHELQRERSPLQKRAQYVEDSGTAIKPGDRVRTIRMGQTPGVVEKVEDGYVYFRHESGKLYRAPLSNVKLDEEMSRSQEQERERIVKGMKKNKAEFADRYGKRGEEVMYATATKRAMGEDRAVKSPGFTVGDRVEYITDSDIGTVVEVNGSDYFVDWESGQQTWAEESDLRLVTPVTNDSDNAYQSGLQSAIEILRRANQEFQKTGDRSVLDRAHREYAQAYDKLVATHPQAHSRQAARNQVWGPAGTND